MLKRDFIQRMKRLLGDEYDAFEAALGNDAPVSIRINPRKFDLSQSHACKLCGENGVSIDGYKRDRPVVDIADSEKVAWCETGYYLSQRPSFSLDPLFHAGAYYVQEASSMFLEQAILTILGQDTPLRHRGEVVHRRNRQLPPFEQSPLMALDLCAAPGGKSTHLSSLLPDGSLLVCNETIRSRSLILAENMTKWGHTGTFITQNDPKTFSRLPHLFDMILADLPCSGEGMFRKNPATRNEWSIENVRFCAARQRRIIYDCWETLKPGGHLVYSTCTFNTEENEENVKLLSTELGAEIVSIPTRPEWNITGSLCHDMPVYRFFPHRTHGEGFFLALMQKHHDQTHTAISKPGTRDMANVWRRHNAVERTIMTNAHVMSRTTAQSNPLNIKSVYAILSKHLNLITAGLTPGARKGKDFTPSAALALSVALTDGAFPAVDLPYEQAIAYLQREAISLPAGTPKGHVLVTYRNTPLGFVKNIGIRANNLYPKAWRL